MSIRLTAPHWFNSNGFLLRPTGRATPATWRTDAQEEYEFCLSGRLPLTFYSHRFGLFIQPDRHGFTDFATVGRVSNLICPRSFAVRSTIMHDSACREHNLYACDSIAGTFSKWRLDARAAAALFGECVETERAQVAGDSCPWRARAIAWAVRTLGPRW